MDATELMVNMTQNYPSIANLMKSVAMLVGVGAMIWCVWMIYRIEVSGTMDKSQLSLIGVSVAFLFASLLVSFGWTMNMVGNTVWDYGGYIFEAYEGTAEWRLRQGDDQLRMTKDFVILTCRMVGMFFSLWGLIIGVLSSKPDSEHKLWSGIVRMVVGAALMDPVRFLNWFGDMGDRLLG